MIRWDYDLDRPPPGAVAREDQVRLELLEPRNCPTWQWWWRWLWWWSSWWGIFSCWNLRIFCVERKIAQMEEKITSYNSEKKSIKKIKANITSSQQIIVFKRIFSPIMASFAAPDRWKPPITAWILNHILWLSKTAALNILWPSI